MYTLSVRCVCVCVCVGVCVCVCRCVRVYVSQFQDNYSMVPLTQEASLVLILHRSKTICSFFDGYELTFGLAMNSCVKEIWTRHMSRPCSLVAFFGYLNTVQETIIEAEERD